MTLSRKEWDRGFWAHHPGFFGELSKSDGWQHPLFLLSFRNLVVIFGSCIEAEIKGRNEGTSRIHQPSSPWAKLREPSVARKGKDTRDNHKISRSLVPKSPKCAGTIGWSNPIIAKFHILMRRQGGGVTWPLNIYLFNSSCRERFDFGIMLTWTAPQFWW